MTEQAYIAVDFGAESGRVAVGLLGANDTLSLHEVHRFRHEPVPMPDGLMWDLTHLWQETLSGLTEASAFCRARGVAPVSVGVDTWGVDFALVQRPGGIVQLPHCYRDPGFPPVAQHVVDRLGSAALYEATGIQFLPFNSLFQFVERFERAPEPFGLNDTRLLFMPDLFNWLLTGQARVERTIASTGQMLDPRTGRWSETLLNKLQLPTAILAEPIDPGTDLGPLLPEVQKRTGLGTGVRVTATPSHDTASAVAAVPADPDTAWCYLSSGTWSLLGAELDQPRLTQAAAAADFTNELGVAGKTRFLRNIAGLWLVQEIRRQLERGGQALGYAELTAQAAAAEPFRTLIPVQDPAFARPGVVVESIHRYARQTDQPVPESVGQLVRCCLESLALEYRRTLDTLEDVAGSRFDVLHIVGGGGNNQLLNRMTCDAIDRPVVVGPSEATATGNLLTQAIGRGRLPDLAALRRVVADSTELVRLTPDPSDDWSPHLQRYLSLAEAHAAPA